MSINTNGESGLNGASYLSMEDYDRLPELVRKWLMYAPISVVPSATLVPKLINGEYSPEEYVIACQAYFPSIFRHGTVKTYGKDHPQAQEECKWPLRI